MKIVVLDGYALNPGDNPWDEILALGELTVYDRTPPELVYERAKDAEILLTNKTVLSSDLIFSLKNLKMICVLATGYNIVDINAAEVRKIPVCNIPTYGTDSVAQLAFALILEFCHNVRRHSDSVLKGDWCKANDYTYWNYTLVELKGKTFGVIGFGLIGQKTAAIAAAFGMNVLVYDPIPKKAPDYENFRFAQMDEVLRDSDFISLHCPLLPENTGMINAETISKMKRTAFLINTARGRLIDEQALADALNSGAIAGAAVDVLSVEPPKSNNPLLKAKNIIITPHIAWATINARRRLMSIAASNIKAFLSGRPINTVNRAE